MDDSDVLARMRGDWNRRAGEDANYYVAFGRRGQEDSEFLASAAGVVRGLEADFARLRTRGAALEIGCGPGRLMFPLARHFGEIHGVDISDEMIRLARDRLRGVANAWAHHNPASDLSMFPAEKFDFVYSYAVFQHIPSRDIVFRYLAEARRVLRTGGILRCQVNGLPSDAREYDTWRGVRVAPAELRQFALDHDLALLALEGVSTQYLWITCRKMPAGWRQSLSGREPGSDPAIRGISNAYTGEGVVPASGPFAALSLWIRSLPADCDLNHLAVAAGCRDCRLSYLGEPARDGVTQLNAALPEGVRTGLLPVEAFWLGRPLCPPAWVRIIPAGPSVPRLWSVTDGVNLLSADRIASGAVKVTLLEVEHPGQFRAALDGLPVRELEAFCTDPMAQRYEFNFRLPEGTRPGLHTIEMALGRRVFAPVAVEVV